MINIVKFSFHAYLRPAVYGHPAQVCHTLRTSDGPNGRFDRFFFAIVTEVDTLKIDDELASVEDVERGTLAEHYIGGNAWEIRVTPAGVQFEHELEEKGISTEGAFSLDQFKWVLLAWREFLRVGEQEVPVEYEFVLPDAKAPRLIEEPKDLIKKVYSS